MKPTFEINHTSRRRDSFVPSRTGSIATKIDCQFQARAANFAGLCQAKRAPSIRAISADYFRHEAPGQFLREALVFGVIAISAAIPLLLAIRSVAQFVL